MDAQSHRLRRTLLAAGLAVALMFAGTAELHAGGGPQNVFLVVNSRSWASLSIANHFASLRQLPSANVFYLDYGGDPHRIGIDGFRERILQPVLQAIAQRNLGDHIDYIVYSSDFPTAVDAGSEFKQVTLPPPLNPVGSLTGMTYLSARLPTGITDFIAFNRNDYAQTPGKDQLTSQSRGFRSWYGWNSRGEMLEAGGRSYMLSVMLGVTTGRGNSVPQVIDYLTRAASADGKRPGGTIYFAQNGDVRATVREPNVKTAIAELIALGVRAERVEGVLPQYKSDVMGLMVGAATFDWRDAHSTILPGAICEHLTSFGGAMEPGADQTPLSEFLKYGAAGASGTVVEPYAIQAKFPLPQVQVHYARGCSLAEAFYRSVATPRQLLIVGDPLCRPWAKFPSVTIEGLTAGAVVSGDLAMQPSVSMSEGTNMDRLSWYLDGQLIAQTRPGERLTLNTRRLPDGSHEIRVVAAEPGDIESQGQLILPFEIDNMPANLTLDVGSQTTFRWGEPLRINVKIVGGAGAMIYASSRLLGRIEGDSGEITLDPRSLGLGPVTIHAASSNGGPPLLSNRLRLDVQPNEPIPAMPLPPGAQLRPGFLVTPEGGSSQAVDRTTNDDWLTKAGVAAGQKFSLTGVFRVGSSSVYQYVVRSEGPLRIVVDGVTIFAQDAGSDGIQYVPVSLAEGLHQLEVSGTAGKTPRLSIAFGGQGTHALNGDVLRRIDASAKP